MKDHHQVQKRKEHLNFFSAQLKNKINYFGTVTEECEKLGIGYDIVKEECVGHIQKQLETALQQLKLRIQRTKLKEGKKAGKSKRLTDKIIDKMQNHFGEVVHKNSRNLEAMRQVVWAFLKHMVQNDPETLK